MKDACFGDRSIARYPHQLCQPSESASRLALRNRFCDVMEGGLFLPRMGSSGRDLWLHRKSSGW